MDIRLHYRKDYHANDQTAKIDKFDEMNKLEKEYWHFKDGMEKKLKEVKDKINTELNDHKHIYKRSFDAPI